MEYGWSKRKLVNMFKTPESRSDLRNLLMQNFDFLCLNDGTRKRPDEVLSEDSKLFASMPSLNDYILTFDEQNLERIPNSKTTPNIFTPTGALTITHDYFESLPGKTYSIFSELFKKRSENLKFVKNQRELSSKTIACPSDGEIYMFVDFDGSITGITNLVHEYAHAIGYIIKPAENRTDVDYLFGEIESIFHTLLSLDFMEKHIGNDKEIKKEQIAVVNDTISDTNLIRQKKLILSSINDIAGLTLKGFKKYLEEYYSMTKGDIEKALSKPADSILPYLIGEYTAFELYKIYNEDPEYAMYLYNAILEIKVNTPEEFFREIERLGIILGMNTGSYVRKIKA